MFLKNRNLNDSSGNIAIISALLVVPLVLSIGLALDYARAYSAKDKMQHVLDAALLAVAHEAAGMDDGQLTDVVRSRVVSAFAGNEGVTNILVQAAHAAEGISGSVSGTLHTALSGIPFVKAMTVGVRSAVASSGQQVEVAMVLDVTGTMKADMPTLRAGGEAFVSLLTANGRNSNVRIALVPFVGSVNIGNGLMQENWLDKEGASRHAAQTIRGRWIAVDSDPSCAGASVSDPVPLGTVIPAGSSPYEAVKIGCYYANPGRVSNWQLFQSLTNVTWKGCVESRPIPYDIDDTPPGSNPDTRWVPFFSLDGPDPEFTKALELKDTGNNYLHDLANGGIPASNLETSLDGRAFSVLKYHNQPAVGLDEIPDRTNGPNKNCPNPILPLTSDYNNLSSRVAELRDWFNGGTHAVEGISWGLRVLSPNAPFTEGAPYGQARKIMVVFSDGGNDMAGEALGSDNNPTLPFISEYTAYGYARSGRFEEESSFSGKDLINSRMQPACDLVKNQGIEIHVIAMGATPDAVERLRDCASDASEVVSVPRGADLVPHFQKLALQFLPLRLVR